ncbi:MAG: MotA/TolQ/ExbB proton channel family protein [Kiritimatiellae bacterium]|nr:MotA/TolQ/ExbB proton channel family protein [Kiritimatiellia bacterium]MDD5521598.1 MotA/TolQ/ExbB proton channel family protein [Kiritimatiellia bacterium]
MITSRRSLFVLGMIAAVGVLACMPVVMAADASTEVAVVSKGVTIRELVDRGGPMLIVLALASVIGLAMIIYLFYTLRKDQIAPAALRRDVIDKIRTGSLQDVRTTCNYRPSALADVTLVALDFVEANSPVDPNLLKDVIEGEGSRQASAIQSQTQYLLDVGVISPMIGLLGTVFGMVHAFNVVAFDLAKAKPMLLAAGVSEALINTAGGLIVGIPAMMFYAYFRGRASKLVSQLEVASTEVMTSLLKLRNNKI